MNPTLELEKHLIASGCASFNTLAFASYMDNQDPLRNLRQEFEIPKIQQPSANGRIAAKECIYFCGNSLGAMPKKSKQLVEKQLLEWANIGVEGWFRKDNGRIPWVEMEELEQPETLCINTMATIVGATAEEVAVCNSLTANLHALLTRFYQPTSTRFKILIEAKAFPSDTYAVTSHIKMKGFDPENALIQQRPRSGEYILRTEDILNRIENDGNEIAIVLFSGIQYYTGQLFRIEEITRAAQAKGCIVGWDLAHAVGNVPLKLHDWNVDFAVWCTYKYLNSGPGGIGGLFVHEKHCDRNIDIRSNRLAGWWGVDKNQRFEMEDVFVPKRGAAGYVYSTPSVLQLASLRGSLQVFAKTDMQAIRSKSVLLTAYLERLLKSELPNEKIKIITPDDPEQRGAQLSLIFPIEQLDGIFNMLEANGIICDKRKPDCIRLAPVPLYCKFIEVFNCVRILKEILSAVE